MYDITQFLTSFGGLAVFTAVFADQAGLPIPAPPLLLAAGSLAAGGKLNPVLAAGMTAAATLLADSLWFYLGRKGSGRALHLLSRWSHSRNASSAQASAVVARYGLLALAVAKFLPGAVMPSLAGALGMSTRRFLLFDGLAALFYGCSYISAGFLFHNQIQQVMVWFDRVGHGVIGLGSALLVGYVAYKYALWRRTRSGKGRSSNMPDKKTSPADVIKSVAHPDPANLVTDGPQHKAPGGGWEMLDQQSQLAQAKTAK
jgi:membrane protein DedA with SNARE-associated domain